MLFTLLAFAIALGSLIIFHEFGHYWVARLCGVRVLRFSLGFGRVVLRRIDKHGTEWAISALPLGGYVKMQDDAPPGAPAAEAAGAFNAQPVGKRIAIVLAGPVFNLLLAVLLYTGPEPRRYRGAAGHPWPSRPRARPPRRRGWRKATAFSPSTARKSPPGRTPAASARRAVHRRTRARSRWPRPRGAAHERELMLPPNRHGPGRRRSAGRGGIRLAQPRPVVRSVIEGGEGQAAGLRQGDRIVAADGQPATDTGELVRLIQESAGRHMSLSVQREGALVTVGVTPRAEKVDGREIGRLGVQLGADIPRVTVSYGLGESLQRAAARTWDTAWFSLRMMGRMVLGEVSWRNVSGPVTIADYAGQTARIGIVAYIAYIALISISLGVLNLLPIPMLDGGHLLYYLVEIVRGSPPPERWIGIGQRAGLGILVALMGLALFNDFTRLFT
ncbi:RIP metalloprotease RseP [Achromobacter sp. DMS1]|uniref:RIP metalloprotease RseP n=1 Tax=Achromobacter sp. DMS1 TaxID=1688405 RepID=UPI000AE1C3B9